MPNTDTWLQSQTSHPVICPVARVWVWESHWGVPQEMACGEISGLTLVSTSQCSVKFKPSPALANAYTSGCRCLISSAPAPSFMWTNGCYNLSLPSLLLLQSSQMPVYALAQLGSPPTSSTKPTPTLFFVFTSLCCGQDQPGHTLMQPTCQP